MKAAETIEFQHIVCCFIFNTDFIVLSRFDSRVMYKSHIQCGTILGVLAATAIFSVPHTWNAYPH
mgnify:CR=1 FL=1